MKPHGLLALVGATATGKSALAIEVAERLSGEVISADAFAVYRGLDVGTAKPSAADRARVPHHLIDVMDPTEPYSAGVFAKSARALAAGILARGRLPILCGGTGFYVRSFFEGLFEGPTRHEGLRRALEAAGARRGNAFLKRAVDLLDPESGAKVLTLDATKAIRLLEIAFQSGRRPSQLFREHPGERWELPAVKVLLVLPRETLYARIARRFEGTFRAELPAEVERLLAAGVPASAPGFAAIGYRDTVALVEGRLGREEWEERILRDTRRFAKRQETWFRKEAHLIPLCADAPELVDSTVALAQTLFS